MKLYYVPGVCSLASHIALREMGAEFQLDKVDRQTKIAESGVNYNKLNPKSYVPALQLDDGSVLTEGASILLYLADQEGGEKVAPKPGTKERYKLQEWLGSSPRRFTRTSAPCSATRPTRRRARRCRSASTWSRTPWQSSPGSSATISLLPTRTC